MNSILFAIALALTPVAVGAQTKADTTLVPAAQATGTALTADTTATTDVPKRGFMKRLLDYFNDANKEKKNKRFDFSIIGGPHYSTDTKLGIGLVAAGLYRTDPTDSLAAPSNVSLFGDVSTVGFYMLGVRGTHKMPADRQRIDYTLYFYSFPCYIWGMGYDMGDNNDNKSKMKRWQAQAKASWLWRTTGELFLGPTVAIDYVRGHDFDRPELIEGQRAHTFNMGVGLTAIYDTRDNLTAPHRGMYISLQQLFRPKFMGNRQVFATTDLRIDGYVPAWSGATIAADLRTQINVGSPQWSMLAQLGDSYSMRGYYQGRYRDKGKIEAQVELRQHIWRRNGIALWAGAGTVFPKISQIQMRHILPNFGVGYRWEFKKNVNVRLDYGLGKGGQSGFIFNINEAF